MKFVTWVHSYNLKVLIAIITEIPCLYSHVHFVKNLPLRAVLEWSVNSDGPQDGDQVCEPGLICIQMMLPPLSQSS